MQSIYNQLKVNNEIEVCEVTDLEIKRQIEKEFLKNRISYFIRCQKLSLFRNRKEVYIFCVHDNVKDLVEEIIKNFQDVDESKLKLVCRKSTNNFL